MNSLDQRNRIRYQINIISWDDFEFDTCVKFKMLIWHDGIYLIHRPLPLEVKALNKANRNAGVL